MSEEKVCPDCAENVKAAARKCRFCGHEFKEPGLLDKAMAAAESAATEQAEKIKTERTEREASGQPEKFRWTSGKGCLILIVGFFVIITAIGAISNAVDPEGAAQREAEREAAAQAEKEQKAADKQAKIDAEAAEKEKGFHCLSSWDGSNRSTETQVKAMMRNPDSFEHIETKIAPVKDGKHVLLMQYRAQNGFGGMNVATAVANLDNATCDATVVSVGE